MTCPHTVFYKGKKIRIVLKDGTEVLDKYLERTRAKMITEHHSIDLDNIKSATIYKRPPRC